VQSMEYCTGLFVCGLEVCAHLVVGGVCVAEVHGGVLRLPDPHPSKNSGIYTLFINSTEKYFNHTHCHYLTQSPH